MIRTFRCQETEKIFKGTVSKKFPVSMQRRSMRKLWMIHSAGQLRSLQLPPSNHLEALKKDRIGQYSVRINRQYRVCFRWHEGNAYDVEIVDYH